MFCSRRNDPELDVFWTPLRSETSLMGGLFASLRIELPISRHRHNKVVLKGPARSKVNDKKMKTLLNAQNSVGLHIVLIKERSM